MRRALALATTALALACAAIVLSCATPVAAQDGGDGTTPVTAPHIIPRPNTGVAPQRAGDRGSGTQYLVMLGVFLAPTAIVVLIARESRRKRAAQAATTQEATSEAPTRLESTRSEPVAETSSNAPDSSARQ